MTPKPPPEEFAPDFAGQDVGRQERLRRLVQQSPKDRIADMTQRVNKPSECQYCGSTWFSEMIFNQYSADAYSAAPGGDIQPISLMPMPIRVCLCGMPMAPNLGGASLGGRTPNESVFSFNGSLRIAAAKTLQRGSRRGGRAVGALRSPGDGADRAAPPSGSCCSNGPCPMSGLRRPPRHRRPRSGQRRCRAPGRYTVAGNKIAFTGPAAA